MRKTSMILVTLLAVSCGDDDDGGNTPDGGGNVDAGATVVTLTADGDVRAKVQAAFQNAVDGTTFVFEPGTYAFSDEISLISKKRITIRGNGADRAAVVWDFSALEAGSPNGFTADMTDDLVIEKLTVVDSPGDAIRVSHANNVTFRNLHIYWKAGSVTANGAYAIYPVLDENILVENCLVQGASDAGIYVGQSKNAMIRNNVVTGNVTGIEVENTDDAEVTGNMAMDNVSGILVFNLPNLERKTGSRTKVHGNMILNNNHAKFAVPGSIVSYVPSGSGMVLLANDDAEIHDNTIMGHNSVGIVMVSCPTLEVLTENAVNCADAAYDVFAETIHIHDNTFSANGTMPQEVFAAWPNKDIIWDGVANAGKGDGVLCIQDNGTMSYAKLNVATFSIVSTDVGPHDCTFPALAGVNVTWGQ